MMAPVMRRAVTDRGVMVAMGVGRGLVMAGDPMMTPGGMAVMAMAVRRMTMGRASMASMATVMGRAVVGLVGRGGHGGVAGHVIGIVERIGGVAVRIVLGGRRAGDGDEDAGEGGQLGEGEFHGRSLEDRPL